MRQRLFIYKTPANICAFSTTRFGGVSLGSYESFNVTDYCGDQRSNVDQNRKILCEELGISCEKLFIPHQVHGTKVVNIDDGFLKENSNVQKQILDGVDALMTNIPRICIGVSTADCVPILLYDESRRVSAAVHAGWRGTLSKILHTVVMGMTSIYECKTKNIKAIVGPSISLASFEVGREVYTAFSEADFPMDSIARFYPTTSGDVTVDGIPGKWHLDLWAANCIQMENCGILLENIQIANVCTFKSSADWFSARRLGFNSGRIYTGILMK